MKKLLFSALLCFVAVAGRAQYYFPPNTGSQWDTVSPVSLGWCTNKLDTVFNYLADKNSKAFIILKGGKIAVEKYFDQFTVDSPWYWASAGKTITSFLIGLAQEDGKLNITDSTSKYLGAGWTQAPADKEKLITIWHQLSMSSGLDDGLKPTIQIPDPDNCLEPECLQYLADAGTRWAYHNAPYRLLQDVIDSATGLNMNQYTTQKLLLSMGMKGLWIDYVYYSTPREMARFGSLIINKGKWNSNQLMKDSAYFNAMVNTSQSINPSYGYLWWLNGKSSYKIPTLQTSFPGPLVPNAPMDMFAGLGKNDQKLYIIPSMDMVIVRMGDASGQPVASVSSMDNELWGLLKEVFCPNGPPTGVEALATKTGIKIYPNPANGQLYLDAAEAGRVEVLDITGRVLVATEYISGTPITITGLANGVYSLVYSNQQVTSQALFIKE